MSMQISGLTSLNLPLSHCSPVTKSALELTCRSAASVTLEMLTDTLAPGIRFSTT